MKKTFTFLFSLALLFIQAQNYALFNSVQKKVFTTYPQKTIAYSLSLDSTTTSGTDSLYYNYFLVRDTAVPSACPWWGPMDCNTQDKPSWIGRSIWTDNMFKFRFVTLNNDTLKFDFNFPLGDTSQFYADASQKFLIVYSDHDTSSVLGVLDSVKTYTILNTDLSGNVMPNALSYKNISVGKYGGLLSFFQVDSFPSLLKPLGIIGRTSPNAGFYKFENEDVYDHQPGDVIQSHHMASQSGGPPWNNYDLYIKYTFLSRTVTVDSIKYVAQRITDTVTNGLTKIDTVILQYYRFTPVSKFPFEQYDGNDYINLGDINTMYMGDYCGEKMWTYKSEATNLGYCETENCWGQVDLGGPAVNLTQRYVAGIGLYSHSEWKFGFPPTGYSKNVSVTYFSKNGVSCGTEVFSGFVDITSAINSICVYPNPSSGNYTVKTFNVVSRLDVLDVAGRVIKTVANVSENTSIDLTHEPAGIYFIRALSNGVQTTKKIVLLKN